MAKELKNKPLIEAILEIRWKLKGNPPAPQIDPHYKLLLARLFDRMGDEYPDHEQLPMANFPDEMAAHVVQHRFRVAANSWPLVQVGPGIFSVNSTADYYTWADFRPRALSAIKKLYEAHPKVGDLQISNIILRYIDAVDFDYISNDSFEFLKNKLKLNVSLAKNLFENTGVESKPSRFTWQCSFRCKNPKGMIHLRFSTGRKKDMPAIVWDTIVESAGNDLPEMPNDFESWLDAAHDITDDWFFKIIEGELERRFLGE